MCPNHRNSSSSRADPNLIKILGKWLDRPVPDSAWKSVWRTSREQAQWEQDKTAGGRRTRHLTTLNGHQATARIVLRRRSKTRRVYAYLCWVHGTIRYELLLGEISQTQRSLNLHEAWRIAHDNDLLQPTGRAAWRCKVTPSEQETDNK